MPDRPRVRRPTFAWVTSATAAALATLLLAGCGPTDLRAEAIRLQQAGNLAGSLEPLREALEEHPDDAELNYLYGLALARLGHTSTAIWSLRKAAEDPEWLTRAGMELASAELYSGNPDRAIDVADRVIAVEPDNVPALLFRATARVHSRRNLESALADADRVLELDPDNLEALVPRAIALLGLQRVEESEAALAKLAERFRSADPLGIGNERYCVVRAIFENANGDPDAADRTFTACLEEFPAGMSATSEAIKFHDAAGRFDRSLEILENAVEASPQVASYREGLALRLAAAGRTDEAEQLLLAGTEVDSPQLAFNAWMGLASYYLQQEEYGKRVHAIEQAVEFVEEPDPNLLFHYADALMLDEKYDAAVEVASRIELPVYSDVILGRTHLAQGRPQEALDRFSASLVYWPDNALVRYYAARAAERLGDIDRAIEEYRYSIRSDASATDARKRLGLLHLAEGDFDEALVVLGHRASVAPMAPDLELVWFRVAARKGMVGERNLDALDNSVSAASMGDTLAVVAEGAVARSGPGAAVRIVRALPQLDLAAPGNAAILPVLIADLIATGRAKQAIALLDSLLTIRPGSADLHALRGRALAAAGDDEAAGAAIERALSIEAENARALDSSAHAAAAAGELDAALAMFARAVASDPDNADTPRAAAELLIENGRRSAAESALEAMLIDHPFDAEAARMLAELRLDRKLHDARTLALARNAVRFRGGADAYDVLARVHERRGEVDLADEAKARARSLRPDPAVPAAPIDGPSARTPLPRTNRLS